MSKKGENIYKRKDGRWEGRYIKYYDENGKAKYGYVYAKTYGEVKKKLVESISHHPCQDSSKNERMILYSDLLNAWLQSERIGIKESTYARYAHLINTHIRPVLGKYQIAFISTALIESFVENKLTNGRVDQSGALSPKTVIDIVFIVKSSIEYAKYNNYAVICNLDKLCVKNKEKEMRVLSRNEQACLVGVLLDEIDLSKFGVLLSLYSGIRIGELCALQWEDFDLENSALRIRKTMQRLQDSSNGSTSKTKLVITEPKSSCSIRTIPLPSFIVEYAKQFVSHPKSYILSSEKNKYVEPRTMQYRFKKYIGLANIDPANFHALRHTFATRCVEIGFDIKSLSEVLGHANVNITLNRYVHSSFELKTENMNKLTLNLNAVK